MDWILQRKRFAADMARVTKQGGFLLVACPNRLFPVDFFHGTRFVRGIPVRVHASSEQFLLSYKDVVSLFIPHFESFRSLPLQDFLNMERLAASLRLSFSVGSIRKLIGLVPARLWRSAFTPYLLILMRRTGSPGTLKPARSD
jgi:hypothetical protein